MIPNSSTRLFQQVKSADNRVEPMYVTKAINLGQPQGAFSLGIPADKIAGDSHYVDATEHRASIAASRATREVDFRNGVIYPTVGEPGYSPRPANNKFGNIALYKDDKKLGYAHPSAVSDPIFIKKNDGTYKPIAYMVFKRETIDEFLQLVPLGYRLEDEIDRSQMDERVLYQGPTDNLFRRDDGNWVVRAEMKDPYSSDLRQRRNDPMKATNQPQNVNRTEGKHNFSEEPDGDDAESSDTSPSQHRGTTIIGQFTFNYENIDEGTKVFVDTETENSSDDDLIDRGTGGTAPPSQIAAPVIRAELLQGGIHGKGMWTVASMGVLLYIGIMAKLGYDIYRRSSMPKLPESNPNFDSTVYNAFEKCAIELGFDLTAADKKLISSLVEVLKDCFGKKLGTIGDIGASLECHPDGLAKNLGAIYGSFTDQMEAIAATAGLLSPSACLILLSLVFLLTYGAI